MYFSAAVEMNAFFRRTQKQLNGWAIHSRRFYIIQMQLLPRDKLSLQTFYACTALGHNGWRRQSLSLPDSDNKKAAGICWRQMWKLLGFACVARQNFIY
jgi:hypothetical protein